jgi:SM-20-related protein
MCCCSAARHWGQMANNQGSADVTRKGMMPPHIQMFDILREDELAELQNWAIGNENLFEPAKVFSPGGHTQAINVDRRTALKLRDFGPMAPMLRQRLMERLPEIMKGTGYSGPQPTSLEFELNAYGEGGHFGAHMDVSAGPNRRPVGAKPGEDRVISAVYYFYKEPKAFSGGALRLFPFVAGKHSTESNSVAYEPQQNSLVAFPSWAWHQVERVSCPSDSFADYRFGLNCWFCRALGT